MENILKQFETNLDYHFSEVLESLFAKPLWIYISLSHKCTYSCQMCGVVKILKEHELPLETVKNTLDEIAGWKSDSVILFTGGEVFLRKDIFELVDYSVKKGLITEAVSNGSLIDAGLAEKIIGSGLNNIAVSLDGAKEFTHDGIREKGAFKKALNALENLVKAKNKAGKGPQISVWTTIMKENINELFDIIELVKNIGVECLVYHPVIVGQDDMQNTSPSAPYWIKEDNLDILRGQIDKITAYKQEHGFVAFLHDPYLWIDYFKGALTKKHWKCNPFVFLNIGPDGEARSCGPSFGNIKEMSLEKCLNTREAFEARRQMKMCPKPCLQTCWSHPESDSLEDIAGNFLARLEKDKAGNKKEILKKALVLLCGYEERLKNHA